MLGSTVAQNSTALSRAGGPLQFTMDISVIRQRIALNPFISTVGWVLPTIVSGATITAVVLNLP